MRLFALDLFEQGFHLFVVSMIDPHGDALSTGLSHGSCGFTDGTG
jgi:hypothetical protein